MKENPQSPDVHSARAMLFERMGNPAEADAEYRTALRLAPHDPDVLEQLRGLPVPAGARTRV